MTTFIKAKHKKRDDQTNNDKYKVGANNTEYHIISKLIFRKYYNFKIHHDDKAIISCRNVKNQHV